LDDYNNHRMNVNRRVTDRKDVIIKATLRVYSTLKIAVRVEDLSATGFRCECIYDLSIGTTVWLTLPNMTGLQAEVVRRRDWMYGFMFTQPLYPAILDHIARTYHR